MKLTAEKVLIYLKELLEYNLEELAAAKGSEYIAGERAAYVECLEVLQRWKRANKIGLDYPIEVRFPLE